MSDTPRTDSAEPYGNPYTDSAMIHVPAAFARQLERELTQAQADLGSARRELNAWKQCAQMLADNTPGVCDKDCEVLEVFEKLKGGTK